MPLLELLQKDRDLVLQIASKYGAYNIRVFGSSSREEDHDNSDIDLLVDFDEGRSLFDLIGFKQELEEHFGREADIVTENSLHPLLQNKVRQEAIWL